MVRKLLMRNKKMQPTLTFKFIHSNKKLLKTIHSLCTKFIKEIPLYTGFEWKDKEIVIYEKQDLIHDAVVDCNRKIYIKNVRDEAYTIYILLHELIHLNLMDTIIKLKSFPLLKKGHTRREALVSLLVKKLLIKTLGEKVFLKVKEIDVEKHSSHKLMWEKAEELEKKYILNRKKTLAFYLLQKR
jgi:hypothetical protein